MQQRKYHEVVTLLIFVYICFLTTSEGKENSVASRKLVASSNNSSKLSADKVTNSSQGNVTEELPKPEAWISDYVDDPHNVGEKLHQVSKHIDKYLKSSPSRVDNYYRNRKGEWIYIVPEEELLADMSQPEYVYKSPQTEPIRNSHYRRYPPRNYFRDVRTYDQASSEINSRYIRPVYRDATPSYSIDESGSFLTKLINTGNGFLRYLNPLTYLRSKEPGPSYALYYPRTRQRYSKRVRTEPTSQESLSYRKWPSSYTNVFDNGRQDADKTNDFGSPYRSDYGDYGYEEETYEDSEEHGTHIRKGIEIEKYANNQKQQDLYNPSPPPGYDPRLKDSAEQLSKPHSNHDLNNIYKFHDLDKLLDTHNMGSIEHVRDQQTLDYLKENRLRDDLYIGKDGNLYIRDSIKKRIDRFPTGQRTNNRQLIKSKVDLTSSKEKELKRNSYTTIHRNTLKKGRVLPAK